MIDKNLLTAILTLPSNGETLLFESLMIVKNYTDIQLLSNDEGRVYYKAKIDDLLSSDITEDEIKKLNESGWKIEDDYIVKDL